MISRSMDVMRRSSFDRFRAAGSKVFWGGEQKAANRFTERRGHPGNARSPGATEMEQHVEADIAHGGLRDGLMS